MRIEDLKQGDIWPEPPPSKDIFVLPFLLCEGWGMNTIMMHHRGMDALDRAAYRSGKVRVGLLHEDSAILLIIQFFHIVEDEPIRVFNCSFDAKMMQPLHDPIDLCTHNDRLCVDFIIIESLTGEVIAVRKLILEPDITKVFLDAASTQLDSQNDPRPYLDHWYGNMTELMKSGKLRSEARER